MAAGGYKNPPILQEEGCYETWKNEVNMWMLVTDLVKKKQALAVTLSLKGQARAKALEIKAEDLNADSGMETLLKALDTIFESDKVDIAYNAYSQFDGYKRNEEGISEYIIEFERRHNICKKHDMELPDAVLAFKLLDGAGIERKERQLVLTAVASDIKFSSMKSALKRIFGTTKAKGDVSYQPGITIKQESAFFTQQRSTGRPAYGGGGNQNQNQRRNFSRDSNTGGFQRNYQPQIQKGTNPIDRFGKRSRCAICGSTFHWAKDCEHRDTCKQENVKLTTGTIEKNEEIFECHMEVRVDEENPDIVLVTESFGSAIVDTACTRTVCGQNWFNDFVESLQAHERKQVIEKPSNKTFKFGDGAQVTSVKNVVFPANLGSKKCMISSEVVDCDLPLLLSKETLKKADTVLNLRKDEATMFGKQVELHFTSTGHYCIDLLSKSTGESISKEEVMLIVEAESKQQKQMIIKLHRQFGHASAEKINKLLNDAGIKEPDILKLVEQVCDDCNLCAKFRKTPSRPAVSLPMATEFNETVAVDLHKLDDSALLLHMIDLFTRYSAGSIIKSKASPVFVDNFLKSWMSKFGSPKRLFSDNGGEFESKDVQAMGEALNIEVITTAAYSPWSNGICERHNLTLSEIVKKVKEDRKCSWDMALQWALMAKNSLSNVHGFSAHQLVFGTNPNLPSVLNDKLPALEGTTTSKVVGEHVAALYSARRAYTQAECSDRIRRALRKQVRTSRDEIYTLGDRVYYKRPDNKEWKGPGKVIGQDGVVVFVRHGGQIVRVHVCRLKKVGEELCGNRQDDYEKSDDKENRSTEKETDEKTIEEGDTDSKDDEDIIDDYHVDENPVQNLATHERNVRPENDARQNAGTVKVKSGNRITFKLEADGQSYTADVISRAGKATGVHKNWYNIEYLEPDLDPKRQSVDLTKVVDLKQVDVQDNNDDENGNEVMVVNEVSFEKAKQAEMDSWKRHGVYSVVDNCGEKYISTRWVCTLKEKGGEIVPKARLVARGFEEIQNDDIEKASPTCGSESLKMILAITAQKGWTPNSIDVKTAFLQGDTMDRKVLLKPPKEAQQSGKLWLLHKCVYGMNDASLKWYQRVKTFLISAEGKMSKVDPAIFHWHGKEGSLIGVLACHVDDFLWAGTVEFERDVIDKIRKEFLLGQEENGTFRYVGLEISKTGKDIFMNQNRYTSEIQTINIEKRRALEKDEPVTEKERSEMRSKVGQILWAARQTRPDVVFDVSLLASKTKDAKVKELLEVNKVIKRIKTDRIKLKFQPLSGKRTLTVFADASLGNLDSGGSQGGYFICLTGEDGSMSPLCWNSKRIRRVVRSTLAAETNAMADGVDMGIFLASLFSEVNGNVIDPQSLPIVCKTDCKSLFDALKSTKDVSEKRLRVEMNGIKEQFDQKQLRVDWVRTNEQLADCLTKKGASSGSLMAVLEGGHL